MSNHQITRPSSAVYNRGNARARLTIKILIYVLSVFLVGTILSYFVFYNKKDSDGIAGTPINRSAFGEVTSRGRYDSWNGSTYTAPTSGSGTSDSPYIISSAAQFMYLSKITSGSTYDGKCWKLTTDLDLTSNRSIITWFNGNLDGGSHTIKVDVSHGSIFGECTKTMIVHDLNIEATNFIEFGCGDGSTTNFGILAESFSGVADGPNFYNIHLYGDAIITVTLHSSGTYFVCVGSLFGEMTSGAIADVYVDGITINVIANGSADDGTSGDDNTNQGYYYFGGVVGNMVGNNNGAIDTALWTGTITFGGYMCGGSQTGREIAIGGITGYGSPAASISQGTIAYDYHGINSYGDGSMIGGITGIPALVDDLAETRDLITNSTIDITSDYRPYLTAYTKEVINKERLTYISSGSVISTDNIEITNGSSAPAFTTDANMKLSSTYSGFTDYLFGQSYVMILDSSVNDGYPWMTRWSSYTPTTPTKDFDPTTNGMTGSGTENDPFIITTQAQFLIMANYYNENSAKKGYYWKISPYNATTPAQITFDLGNSWRPIGYDQAHAFTGILNGGGVVITGLGITSNYTYVGLFGYVAAGAKISNLGISATTGNTSNIAYDYDQASYIGGMVGYLAKGAYMENCYFIGKLTGYLNSSASRTVGGLAGYYDNAVSNSSVTPAIKTSYYIADHTIYFKSGTTTNTKSEHMEKIYGTGSTTTSSGILDGKSFTAQSTFTPYGFSFGNLTAVSGSTSNYEWTSAYAGKWHTTAGLYNGYPYLDASDGMYFKISRANVTGGTFTGTYKIGNESKGSLVFTSNVSQSLPVRAVFSYNYTKSATNDTVLSFSLTANSKTLFSRSKTFNTSATSVSESNLSLTNNYKVTGESLIVKDTSYAKHTLTVTNNNADLGSFSRTDSNSLVTATSITNGYKYVGRNSGSTGVNLKFTANAAANSTYYYIDSITVGGSTLYSVSAPTTIKTVSNCTASITAKLGSTAGTANTYATTITLNFSLPNNANTTAIVVKYGKVLTAKQGIIFNTGSGTPSTDTGKDTTLTIVAGSKVTDGSKNLPTKSDSISGYPDAKFIGWLEYKENATAGKLLSTDSTLDFAAESDTKEIKEFWSLVASSVSFTNATHSYTIIHKATGLSYTFATSMTNVLVGDWTVTDNTTGKTATMNILKTTTSVNFNSLTWA